MKHEYPPPPYRYRYPPLTTGGAEQLLRKRRRELLSEDDQPLQRRRTSELHLSDTSKRDEDVAMFEPDAPTDIIMSEVGADCDEDNCVLAHIPGQAPGFFRLGSSIPGKVQLPPAVVPTLLIEEDTNKWESWDGTILPQNRQSRHHRSQSSFSYIITHSGRAKYMILGALLLFSLPVSIFLGINLLDTLPTESYTIGAENAHPAVLVRPQPGSFPRRPDFNALVTIQIRLAAEQLLSSASAIVEATNLTAELLVYRTQKGTSSCDSATVLLGDLHRVRHHLSKLNISIASSIERLIVADSATLTTLQETPELSISTVFNRLVNATLAEFLALKSEIRSGLDGARALANTCETTRALFLTSCLHAACCTGDSLDTKILRQIFLRLDFFAQGMVVQFEEVDTTLTFLQERVRQLTCRSANVMGVDDVFNNQDGLGLKYGIQRLRERQSRTVPFLSHPDNSLFRS